jgi:NADH-quinone oxidoreductase subunit H
VAADLDVGVFYVVSVTALVVIGILLAGWSSNSKWALFGGMRSAAQVISYEIPAGIAILVPVMLAGTLSLQGIIRAQGAWPWQWFALATPAGPLAFLVFFVAQLAEGNRTPFDLPEAESELVSGFNTEYSGVKFAFFFLGEYTAMIIISCVAVTVFFGGWLPPFPNVKALEFLWQVPGILWFLAKVGGFLFAYIWFRSTFPRYRFDQLMALGWKWLIPLALANIVVVAFAVLLFPGRTTGLVWLAWIFGGLFVVMYLLAKLRQKLTRRERLAAEPHPVEG